MNDHELIQMCREVATLAHSGGKTYGPFPYTQHLEAVARLANAHQLGATCEAAAWLHDVVEDTSETIDSLRLKGIPEDVLDIVYAVTDPDGINRKERKVKAIANIKGNRNATLVKLCDRICNVMTSWIWRPDLLEMYQKEHDQFMTLKDSNTRHYLWVVYESIIMARG